MKTLITIVVALIMGVTIFGCRAQLQSTAQDPFSGSVIADQGQNTPGEPIENLPPDEYQTSDQLAAMADSVRQEDVPYHESFTNYFSSNRDELQKHFGIPDDTTPYKDGLVWKWCLTINVPGKLVPKVNLEVKFGLKDRSKRVETMTVEFLDEMFGGKYMPLGSNCASLINNLDHKAVYAYPRRDMWVNDNFKPFYILGKYRGVDVLLVGTSSVWAFDSEAVIDDNGLKRDVIKPNPGFDWKVGTIHSITLGTRSKATFFDSNVDQNIKDGRLVRAS